jgi:hypothetical protein
MPHYRQHQQTVERETQWAVAASRAIVDIALSAIRGIFLVNGGAAVALLAFLGSVWQSRRPSAAAILDAMQPAMADFVSGIAVAVATTGLAYICQHYITLRAALEHVGCGNGFARTFLHRWASCRRSVSDYPIAHNSRRLAADPLTGDAPVH